MEYIVGISLAFGISLFLGGIVGFDRDRSFYPFIAIVSSSYYQLFAIMAGSIPALTFETGMFAAFTALCIAGFRTNLWLVVAALAAHGAFDMVHPHLIANPGVPTWWPMFCMSYDFIAAGYLAGLLLRPSTHQSLSRIHHPIRPYVQAELDAACLAEQGADPSGGFHNLERAHVLSQASTREHVRVHWRMMFWAIGRRDGREFQGQFLRIVGAATKTAIGLVPVGNTGGANVSPFKPMPVDEDIAAILAKASTK